jgi:hypothetical protein
VPRLRPRHGPVIGLGRHGPGSLRVMSGSCRAKPVPGFGPPASPVRLDISRYCCHQWQQGHVGSVARGRWLSLHDDEASCQQFHGKGPISVRGRDRVALQVGLGKKPVTRNPNPEYPNPNPNPKYPKPEFCSGLSGSNLQNPNLVRVIRVSQSGTRNTRTFMCHVLMSCLIINLYIYNYVYVCITCDCRLLVLYMSMYIIIQTIFLY